jgi:hypothetical protein
MTLRSLGKISLHRYQPAANGWDAEGNARNRKPEDDVEDWDCDVTSPTVPWLKSLVDDGWTLSLDRREVKEPDWLNKVHDGRHLLVHYVLRSKGEYKNWIVALAHELLEEVK